MTPLRRPADNPTLSLPDKAKVAIATMSSKATALDADADADMAAVVAVAAVYQGRGGCQGFGGRRYS